MSAGTSSRTLPFLGLLAAIAGATGVGFAVGRTTAFRDVERGIEAFRVQETLGRVVAERAPAALRELGDPRALYGQAYLDPERAAAEMDDYVWAVRSVPTPFVGYAPAPGAHANASINAQQLWHPRDLAGPKAPGRLRIFVTGGSAAFGSGAPSRERTIPGYLRGLLARRAAADVEVVNAASPGWASTHERIWILNRLVSLEPDLVVSFSGLNDVHWSAVGFDVRFFRAYDEQHYYSLLDLLHRRAGTPFPEIVPFSGIPVPPEQVARRLLANLRAADAALEDQGARFLFVLQPSLASTRKALSRRERVMRGVNEGGPRPNRYLEDCYAAIRGELARSSGEIDSVDLSGVFDAAPATAEIFLDAYHFGDRGNELIAQALARELEPRLAALPR